MQATSRALGTGAGPASPQSRGRVGQPRGATGSAQGPRSRGRPLSARSCPHGGSRAPGGGDREAGGHAQFPEPPRSFPDLRALPSGPGSQPRVPAWATAVPRLNPPARGPGEAVPRENEGKHPNPSLGCPFRVPAPLWCVRVCVWGGLLTMKRDSWACSSLDRGASSPGLRVGTGLRLRPPSCREGPAARPADPRWFRPRTASPPTAPPAGSFGQRPL